MVNISIVDEGIKQLITGGYHIVLIWILTCFDEVQSKEQSILVLWDRRNGGHVYSTSQDGRCNGGNHGKIMEKSGKIMGKSWKTPMNFGTLLYSPNICRPQSQMAGWPQCRRLWASNIPLIRFWWWPFTLEPWSLAAEIMWPSWLENEPTGRHFWAQQLGKTTSNHFCRRIPISTIILCVGTIA